MKTRPLHDHVIVKRLESERSTAAGIVIPETAKEKPTEGRVVAVGKGHLLDNGAVRPLDVRVGDRILLGKYSGREVQIEGVEYLILSEEEILAVIENEGPGPARTRRGSPVDRDRGTPPADEDPAFVPGRTISVSIVDRSGRPVCNAEIGVRLDGEPAGELYPAGRPGPYTVEVYDPPAQVELIVRGNGRTLARRKLGPDQNEVSFVVDRIRNLRATAAAGTPVARCPDGTVGAPCVICTIGKRRVRICV